MIEIKFTGGPGVINDSIRNYLKRYETAGEESEKPSITYKSMESNSEPHPHTVTMLHDHPVACTCLWFRYHPLEHWCRHMKEARREALSDGINV